MEQLFYASVGLDRDAEIRSSSRWRQQVLRESDVRILVCHGGDPLFSQPEESGAHEIVMFDAARLLQLDFDHEAANWAYLGRHARGPVLALDISPLESDRDVAAIALNGAFGDMRTRMAALPHEEAALAAQARALFLWQARHRFCGVCGHPNHVAEAGYRLQCSNAACGTAHFPRTDPAVIMLVHHDDHVLLARSPQFLPDMVSVLAGFVEPGETLEQAVQREVYEEVGLRTKTPRYIASQPWPFPGSLMLGFVCEAENTDIKIDHNEIEYAMWVPRNEVHDLASRGIKLPREISIARYLLENWTQGRNGFI
ncbi:NAD(+) diphosphatase [uncultured Thalassospira sp.]|jgi:NAD+ diphosphatase|uniref:NAD(+) diphosphatase n=1 Tax=uncultured Thalassospira sp. TaxID=404382 RepID=UPI0030DD9980|tara:strand:- start:2904 stop:3839 length:936 start_codon:yes stop_codon:yes gene_type:complete